MKSSNLPGACQSQMHFWETLKERKDWDLERYGWEGCGVTDCLALWWVAMTTGIPGKALANFCVHISLRSKMNSERLIIICISSLLCRTNNNLWQQGDRSQWWKHFNNNQNSETNKQNPTNQPTPQKIPHYKKQNFPISELCISRKKKKHLQDDFKWYFQ